MSNFTKSREKQGGKCNDTGMGKMQIGWLVVDKLGAYAKKYYDPEAA